MFSGLDLTVASGEALALVGPNGSGKSTLLRALALLVRPAAGRLAWDGADVAADPDAHRERLHYLGHLDAIKPALLVSEHLVHHAQLQGGDPARAPAALDAVGLGALAELPGRYLSAGQRRRLALARLLVADRPLWLLDEPTAALDDDGVAAFRAIAAAHLAGGGLIVASTHHPLGLPGPSLRPVEFAPEDEDEPE